MLAMSSTSFREVFPKELRQKRGDGHPAECRAALDFAADIAREPTEIQRMCLGRGDGFLGHAANDSTSGFRLAMLSALALPPIVPLRYVGIGA